MKHKIVFLRQINDTNINQVSIFMVKDRPKVFRNDAIPDQGIEDEIDNIKMILEGDALIDEAEQFISENPDILDDFNPEKIREKIMFYPENNFMV